MRNGSGVYSPTEWTFIQGDIYMKGTFVDVDRDTLYLLPPSIQEWLPEKHLARFVVEIVDQIDLQPLKASYRGSGSQPYSPEMMVALLFYGYATGVFSSRKLERSTYDSLAFRYIAANSHPDHDTIATFRRRFLPELTKIFVEILAIAHEMKVLKLGKVSIDGTKVKANASKHKALSYGHACKLEKQLEAEVAELLKKAESVDKADIPDGMDIPNELSLRQERVKAIKGAKAEIERRAAQRQAEEQKVYETKVAERAKKEQQTGKKARGKKPQPPKDGPAQKDQVNLNDMESRIMPVSGGGFEQAYNVQAGVDMDTMKHRLKTTSGKAVYAKRKSTIEPVFGIIKSVMGFRQFLLRGVEAVKGEWDLVCIAFNLKRLFALAK